MSDESKQVERLYGLPGAERLHTDPAAVWESEIEPWRDDGDFRSWEVEEFDVHPPSYHLPTVETLCDWLTEYVDENGEVCEGYDVEIPDGSAQAFLDAVAGAITFRMARTKLATHTVTIGDDGDPLWDGEPLYVTVPAAVQS